MAIYVTLLLQQLWLFVCWAFSVAEDFVSSS